MLRFRSIIGFNRCNRGTWKAGAEAQATPCRPIESSLIQLASGRRSVDRNAMAPVD